MCVCVWGDIGIILGSNILCAGALARGQGGVGVLTGMFCDFGHFGASGGWTLAAVAVEEACRRSWHWHVVACGKVCYFGAGGVWCCYCGAGEEGRLSATGDQGAGTFASAGVGA